MIGRILAVALAVSTVIPASAQEKFLGSIWKNSATAADPDTLFGSLFDQVTPENAGKWGRAEPADDAYEWTTLDDMFAAADSLGLVTKQHTFVWGQQQPEWVSDTNAQEAVEDWIRDCMERYGNRVDLIDVVNEPLHALPAYRNGLGGDGTTGWDWVVWTFKKARQYAPGAKLLLNDYDILKSDYNVNRYIPIIRILQDSSLIDGIGLQAHFLESISAAAITQRLNTLGALGLPVYISEYDCNIAGDSSHLEVFSAQFTAFWEHPAVKGVTVWGHREGHMWRTNGYLVREDGSARPALTWLLAYLGRSTGAVRLQEPQAAPMDPAGSTLLFDIAGRKIMSGTDLPAGIYLRWQDGTRPARLIHHYGRKFRP